MTDLKTAAAKLKAAKNPEEIFGDLGPGTVDDRLMGLRDKYRDLAMMLHPDRHGGSKVAGDAIAALNRLRDVAEEKLRSGRWGQSSSATSITAGHIYVDVLPLCAGDICDVYQASWNAGARALIKVAREPRDRDLVENEAKVLERLRTKPDKESAHYLKYLPTLLESAQIKVGKTMRAANMFEHVAGGHTLAEVIARYPGGLDTRHVAWLWKRLLEVLDWVHRKGVIHGAITPDHILVFPKNHGIHLLDWSYSVPVGGQIKAIPAAWRGIYPEEIFRKKSATTGADLYMVAKCVGLMIGPQEWPRLYAGVVHASTLPAMHRYQKAFEVYEQLEKHLRTMFGKPKFVELTM